MYDQRRVHQARRHELTSLADVLSRSFFDDPVMSWLMPEERNRYRRLRHAYLVELAVYHRRNVVYTTSDHGATALWAPPLRWRERPTDVIRSLPRLLAAFQGRSIPGLRLLQAVEKVHPQEPHWYLGILGADPARQGTGAGRAVVDAGLAHADQEGLGAYLESSKAANIPFYERFGFRVTGEVTIAGSPTQYTMWRDPRS